MAKKEDTPAKRAVLGEWDVWAAKHSHEAATLAGGMVFFTYLQKEHPDLLLDFKSPGDNQLASRPRMATAGAARQRVVAGVVADAEPSPAVLWMELGPVRATTLGGAFSLVG